VFVTPRDSNSASSREPVLTTHGEHSNTSNSAGHLNSTDNDNTDSVLSVNTCSPVLYAVNELSALKYIDVSVMSDDNDVVKPVTALCDSGAEICVIKSAMLKDLSPNVVGEIQLRPFCGDAIKAELVRLTVSPVNSDVLSQMAGLMYGALLYLIYMTI